ncbi:MAG: RNA polymerase sigma factor [Pseudolactococcus laudensis]|uniref:RNA polymerase sigma factor n=1 Tax=Pseudolactococcus laudensis TaxID=1494461 RepID=UPI001C60609D|nr:RNA polymerase sigma factor [Lactococcus laudensis]
MTCASEIQRYLIKTGANPADAQDIVQDVFIKLIQADIVLAPDKLRPWLYRVALSRFYDLYRREKRYRALLSERFYLIYGNVVNLDNDRSWQLEQALQTLTDYQLGLVTLYYEDDKSVKDISEIYQISEAKVKTDLYRLRHKLKQEMEQNNEDE